MMLASRWVPLFRELAEVRYLWQQPMQLNNHKPAGFLGSEPQTPLDQAIETTLRGLHCIPA